VGLFGIAACGTVGDNLPTTFKSPTSARFAIGEATNDTPELGKLKLCKSSDSNISGVFAFLREQFGDPGPTPSGTALASLTLQPGECRVVAEDFGGNLIGSRVRITEVADNLVSVSGQRIDQEVGGTATTISSLTFANAGEVVVNIYHGAVVTFTNRVAENGCTYTKGWYRNKNGSQTIIAGIDGRSIAEQQAIFDATPGKPGGVTFGADNNNLNLYQQLLAALNNLDGNPLGGPPAVDAAIAAALAATGGSGLNITVAAGTDVSGLISVLSAFNEGQYAGFPHCDDQILE
jgi:hypothetical protein